MRQSIQISVSILAIAYALAATGCASAQVSPLDSKRKDVLACIKDLASSHESSLNESYEVCRQLYYMKKVGEK